MLAVTSLVKNRVWILPYFLNCLYNLAYPREATSVILLDDASTDGSRELLDEFRVAHAREYRHLLIMDNPNPVGTNTSSRGMKNRYPIYRNLARLRNRVLRKACELECKWQFSVDTDILFVPDVLQQLGQHHLPYVSTIIINDATALDRFDYDRLENRHVNFGNLEVWDGQELYVNFPYQLGRLHEVMISGACYLINEQALYSGAEYGFHHLGEDTAYCLNLRERGIGIVCDTTPKAVHVMEPRFLPDAQIAFQRLMTGALIGMENRQSSGYDLATVNAVSGILAPSTIVSL